MKKIGKPLSAAFIKGFLMNDTDRIELINAWVNIDNAVGLIEDTANKKEGDFDSVKELADTIYKEGADIYEIESSELDEDNKSITNEIDVFIYKSDEDTVAFVAHHGFLIAFWND